MPTIIDQLVVTLGLDPKQFKQGQQQATKAVSETEDRVKKSADAMVSGFRRVAAEFVGMFLAVRSISDVVGFFENLNKSTRQLGYDSKNFGIAANELKDWQNAAVLAGGKSEDVIKTIGSLQKSLFDLKYSGQFSDQLAWLQRLGVQFMDASGHARAFTDVMIDTAAAIEKSHMSRPEAEQYLLAAGFDQGSINQILQGSKATRDAIAAQRKQPQVTTAQVKAATDLGVAWDKLKQSIEAGSRSLLVSASPAIQTLFGLLQEGVNWLNGHREVIANYLREFSDWVKSDGKKDVLSFFSDLRTIISGIADAIKAITGATHAFKENGISGFLNSDLGNTVVPVSGQAHSVLGSGIVRSIVQSIWQSLGDAIEYAGNVSGVSRGIRNANPGNIKATNLAQPQDDKGFRIFRNQREGIQATNAQLDRYSARGINTISGIVNTYAPSSDGNNVPAYIDALKKSTGKGENEALSANDRQALLMGLFRQESGPGAVSAAAIASALGTSTPGVSGAASAASAATPTPSLAARPTQALPPKTSNNNVDIGTILIQTQATDANGIMGEAARAARRKFAASFIDSGLA